MARWNSCNILQLAPGASRLWQFDAKGGFKLNRDFSSKNGEPLPAKFVAKSWGSLWSPMLNIAWLPPQNVFLRVVELPASSAEETRAMVELQLEKLSPIPVTQIVWTLQILPQIQNMKAAADAAEGDAKTESLQTVIVVIAERNVVEEFLGKLETQGYLADRLEAPMLDQLVATPATEDGAWIYPSSLGEQSAALVAWRDGGALRNLSFIVPPASGDRAVSLKNQLAQLVWAGEMEGWLTAQPKWHLVAEGAVAAEWETALRTGLGEPVQVVKPLPIEELAAHTARRAVAVQPGARLLPAEFTARYHQQFVDRLWLRGLMATGVLYVLLVVIYLCGAQVVAFQARGVEQQVAGLSASYTNVLQLKARYEVLKERQDLKYAALDCWRLTADLLPSGIVLQRFSFADGRRLSLSGTVTPDQIGQVIDFNDALRKAPLNGQPMFAPNSGDQLVYRQSGNAVTWNFSVELQRTEDQP